MTNRRLRLPALTALVSVIIAGSFLWAQADKGQTTTAPAAQASGSCGRMSAAGAGACGSQGCATASAGCCRKTPTTAASQPAFANAHCPMMGSAIDPAKVPDSLVRTHKGQRVAFCCGGCPAGWDKLSDAEKDAKLEKVLVK